MNTNPCRKKRIFLIAHKIVSVITLIFFTAGTVFALPTGQQVVNGQASFITQSNNLTINNSPNAIINWQGFAINNNEAVRFLQQNSASSVLNRVIGQDPSRIFGLLQSNGRVFLINPNGILFGQGARIDVNGLFASTLAISNQDFLAGKFNFSAGAIAGSIQNQGTITTPAGGKVYLIAPDIENSGIINSPQGEVLLAAGHSVQLVDSLNPDIAVVVSAPTNRAVNLGQIVAQSGKVGIYGGLISQRGIINADSAVSEGGRIFLRASKAIELTDTSVISADGTKGGQIIVKTEENGQISGTLTARGTISAQGDGSIGSGGFVETSAKTADINDVRVNTRGGTWLLDPDDVDISSNGTIAGATLVTPVTIQNALVSNNFIVQTDTAGTGGNGDIFVNGAVSWGSNYSLTLKAHNNINVNQPLSSTGFGNLVLRADSDASGGGNVIFGASGQVYGYGGSTSIYYNPPSGYSSPTIYSANFTVLPSGFASMTAYMLVNDLNNLQAINTNLAGVYALGKDIDASATSGWNIGEGFLPIGDSGAPPFSGTFDGDGHVITGLYINRPSSTNYVGLFGQNSGTIRNVGLVNGNITGNDYVGGLVGYNDGGTISNSFNTSTVSGRYFVGGLVGYNFGVLVVPNGNYGNITNSYSTGAVSGDSVVGGLVGVNSYGSISDSYSTGAVTVNGSSYSVGGGISVNGSYGGGLVGLNEGEPGDISYISGTISNSYSTGAVIGPGDYVGGLVGYNKGGITNSYWDETTAGPVFYGIGYDEGWAAATDLDFNSVSTRLTTAQMMSQSTFCPEGCYWDFTNTWWMSDTNTRPFLRMEYSTTITNAHQLQLMGMNATTLGASYTLANNIDMSELTQAFGLWNTTTGFVPVGTSGTPFSGTLDGLGYTITGLYIKRPTTDYVGLFGYLAGNGSSSGIVKNVGLVNSDITGQSNVGGLVGYQNYGGIISNSYNNGTVNGSTNVGGLVGYGDGSDGGSIAYSYNTGAVNGGAEVGGLVGYNNGPITNSYNKGTVTGSGDDIGGLVGYNDQFGTISNSYSTAAVSGTGSIGGLVGYHMYGGAITNSYSTGAVTGTGDDIGGLVGYHYGTLSNSYSTGKVTTTGTSLYIGGLVGYDISDTGGISSSFWNTETSGQSVSGAASGNNAGANGLLTADMVKYTSFSSWGTDITNAGGSSAVWRIYDGNTYPLLRSFLTPATVTANDAVKTYNGLAYTGGNGVICSTGICDAKYQGTLAYGGTSQGAINATGYTIVPTGYYSDQQGYDISFANGTLTVNQAALTVTANPASKTYNGLAYSGGNGVSYTGFVNGETATVLGGTLAYSGTSQGAINAGSYVITPSGLTSGNYAFTFADGTLTVNPFPVSLAGSRIYDGTANVAAGILTLGPLVTTPAFYETLTLTGVGTIADKNAGTGRTVNVSGLTLGNGYSGGVGGPPIFIGGLASNYTFTGGTQTVNITPAVIANVTGITANNKTYDGTTSATLVTTGAAFTNMIAGDSLTVGAATGLFSDKNVATGKPVDITGIALGGLDSGNYTLALTTAATTADITARPITITATTNTKGYDRNTSAAALPTITVGSLVVGDTATLTEVYDSKTAGTGKTLTPSAIIADGNSGNNYLVTYVNNTTGVIEPGQTISGMLDGAASGMTISFAVNGTLLADQATTDAGGNYSAMFPLNSILSNSALLAYIDGGNTVKGASVYLAPGGNITNLLLSPNTVRASSSGAISSTTLVDAKGALSSSDIPYTVSGNNVTLSSGFNLVMNAGGNITLNGLVNAGTGNITLRSGGAIINGLGSARSISAGYFFAEAVNGIGSSDALRTAVNNVTANNTTSNNIEIINTGVLTVSGLTNGGTGDVILQNAGAITTDTAAVTSAGGSVSITAKSPLTIGAGGVSASDSITLVASPSAGGADNLTINGAIASSNGSIILSAGGSLVFGPGGSLSAPNGTVTLNGVLTSTGSDDLAAVGNNTATDNTVSSLITAMGSITAEESGDDEDEHERENREGGGQGADDKKTDDGKQYCN